MREGHSWDKPSGTKEQRIAIADAVLTESQAKATKAKPSLQAQGAGADGVASRPSRGGGTPAPTSSGRKPRKAPPKGDSGSIPREQSGSTPDPVSAPKRGRGRPRLAEPKSPRAEYQRELMRKRYAEKKGKPDGA